MFHQHTERDNREFGSATMDRRGAPKDIKMTAQQKKAAVFEACSDVMHCLDNFARNFQRDIVDYCVWYREEHTEENTYELHITRLTCHCVVHANILAPRAPYRLVRAFSDES